MSELDRGEIESGDKTVYDMIIVGGGPAGYTAGLYAARAGLSAIVLEKAVPGGQMALTDRIDNYPGLDEGIEGFTLGERMRAGAERFGVKSLFNEVISLKLSGTLKQVKTDSGVLYGKTVVLAMGAKPRELGLAAEQDLVGRGVSYCATCDSMFYRGKTISVVGGGNSAAEDALILSRVCKNVILIHRRDRLRASKIYSDALLKTENVSFQLDSIVTEAVADGLMRGVKLRSLKTNETTEIACDGLFISIGRVPLTELVVNQLELSPEGYIMADESTKTSIPGVFAVGDIRTKPLRQVVTATADGATAVYYAEEYLAAMNI